MALRKFPTWATDDISDIGNGDPNKSDPGTVKQSSGFTVEKPLLQTFNWLFNLFGHFTAANNQYRVKSTGYEAEAGERIISDNSSSPSSVLLPSQPMDGQWVDIEGVIAFSNNSVTVDGNGNDIMGVGISDMELDIDNIVFRFRWDATNSLWKILAQNSVGN